MHYSTAVQYVRTSTTGVGISFVKKIKNKMVNSFFVYVCFLKLKVDGYSYVFMGL